MKHQTITFDQEYSKSNIQILDVLTLKDKNEDLQTTIYINDTQAYLHATSYHPKFPKYPL